jgi:hypothetical protein
MYRLPLLLQDRSGYMLEPDRFWRRSGNLGVGEDTLGFESLEGGTWRVPHCRLGQGTHCYLLLPVNKPLPRYGLGRVSRMWDVPTVQYNYHNSGYYPSSCVFYLKHNVSKTGFCLRRQRLASSIGPT